MSIWIPKRTAEFDERIGFGVCVWELPDGSFFKNSEGDYFCAQGRIKDPIVEQKMRDAIKSAFNITEGKPAWFPGFRKITQNEWEDQMEMLQEGQIADPVDIYFQDKYGD